MTGGFGTGVFTFNVSKTVEVLKIDGTAWCTLPDLPGEFGRKEHTQSGLLTCGGLVQKDNCIRFSEGQWNTSHEGLSDKFSHSAWSSNTHGTRLLSDDKAELLADNGKTPDSFSLVNSTRYIRSYRLIFMKSMIYLSGVHAV